VNISLLAIGESYALIPWKVTLFGTIQACSGVYTIWTNVVQSAVAKIYHTMSSFFCTIFLAAYDMVSFKSYLRFKPKSEAYQCLNLTGDLYNIQ